MHDTAARSVISGWAAAVGVLALVALVYSQTWRELWPLWMDTSNKTYTHGLLVALVSLWLVWRKRGDLQAAAIRPARWVIPVLLLVSLTWMVVAKAGILTLHATLWPLLAWLSVYAICGRRVALALSFPLAYLWFAVPIWDHLNGLLQGWTVVAVDLLNRITQVPASVQGNLVTIPSGQFEIASGCSGLHYFMVALAIAALAGELHHDRPRTRLMLVVLAAALALLTNWLRVYVIILAGHLTDMQHYLVRVDHYKFGWVVFALAMLVFFMVVRRLPVNSAGGASLEARPARGRQLPGVVGGLVAMVMLPVSSWAATAGKSDAVPAPVDAPQRTGFSGPVSPSPAWRPVFKGPDAELRVAYVSAGGRVVDYYVNSYLRQSQSGELIGYSSRLVSGPSMRERRDGGIVSVAVGNGLLFRRFDAVSSSSADWVVVSHYYVGDRFMTNPLLTQLAIGFHDLWRTGPSGIRAAAAPCHGDCESAMSDASELLVRLSEIRQ